MTRVVFVLMPRLHLLDLAGPAQVFSTATDFGHPYELTYVGAEPVVTSHQGVPLGAAVELPGLSADDLVVVPGWRFPLDSAEVAPELLAFLRAHHAAGGTVASVCPVPEELEDLHVTAAQAGDKGGRQDQRDGGGGHRCAPIRVR